MIRNFKVGSIYKNRWGTPLKIIKVDYYPMSFVPHVVSFVLVGDNESEVHRFFAGEHASCHFELLPKIRQALYE